MNHVIEHVHNPEKNIAHCHRLLITGGRLVVVTPNIESLGHRYSGVVWLDLDPPSHIHIISCMTLQKVAHQAGFSQHSAFTTATNIRLIAVGSSDIQKDGRHVMGSSTKSYRHITSIIFQLWAAMVYLIAPGSGEECVLVATK